MRRLNRTGIVVADGVKAKVLRWDSETDMLQEMVATSLDLDRNDHTPSRFARDVACMLEMHHEAGGLTRLIFVAPAAVLDDLAAGLPDNLKRMVVGELAQDMMSASSDALRDALRSA